MLSEPLFYQLAILGMEISSDERDLFVLPLCMVTNHDLSVCSTTMLVRSIVYAMAFELDTHIETVMLAKSHHHQLMDNIFAGNFNCFF